MTIIRTALAIVGVAMAAACAGGVPKAQYDVPAMMPLIVTPDPVMASTGVVKANDKIGRHKVRTDGGAVLTADVAGITRPIPAGTLLAAARARDRAGVVAIYCDVRRVAAFSTYGETDCLQDTNNDGKFDAIWTGRPGISQFTLSLSTAGFHGAIEPAAYTTLKPEESPATEVGFNTYICWNGKPAFVFGIRRVDGDWDFGTGPCAPGTHPGEENKDGVFRSMGATIKVTEANGQSTYEVTERIPPGPIQLRTQRLN